MTSIKPLEPTPVRLDSVCHLITDGKHGDCKNEDGSGYFFISAKDINNGAIQYDNARQITQQDFLETHRRTQLEPLDILLTNSGTIGRLAIAKDIEATQKTTFQKSVAILKPNQQHVYPRWLFYYLQNVDNQLESIARGAAQKNLLLRDLRDFKISLAPLGVQYQIANFISAYDDLIENNRRRIDLLEQSARLLYKEWFVSLCFPGHEHVKVKDGVPEEWRKTTLGEIAPLTYGKGLKADERIPGDYPVYGSSGIVGTHEKALATGPGIIVGRKGNAGSAFWSMSDFYPIDTTYYIDSSAANYFLYYLLLNTQFVSTDVAVPGLNRDYAHSLKISLPSKQLLSLFEETVSPIHKQIYTLEKYNQALTQARDLLLPRLMNGEIPI